MQSFTLDQKRILLENSNVLKITENHLVFTPEFKIKAIKLYSKGMTADEIFISHGFDPEFFEQQYFQKRLAKWRLKHELEGPNAFKTETRGKGATGRPKQENLEDYTIEDLRAIVFIQDEIIDELKKKKALAKK